jgi:hypothetical protein
MLTTLSIHVLSFKITCCLQIMGIYVPLYLSSYQITTNFSRNGTSNLGSLFWDFTFSMWCCRRSKSAGKLQNISKDLIHGSIREHNTMCFLLPCVRKVGVDVGCGPQVWLCLLKVPLKCAVVSLYSVVKQRLKCNTSKVCNCLIQFLLTMVLSIEEHIL